MRCFLATALTAFFSFAWSDAEAATATGTFNVQVTIAPTRKISRAFGVLLLPAWFAASGASAASLQAAPVLLEVVAPAAAATVTLRNNGAKPIATQVRVFRWIQEAGVERLEPTEDVVASPPAVELQPGEDYVARVVRVTKKPVEGEEAYRLFVDELPEAPQGRHTVNLVVRHSIPLFFRYAGQFRARGRMARDAERARRLAQRREWRRQAVAARLGQDRRRGGQEPLVRARAGRLCARPFGHELDGATVKVRVPARRQGHD
ncbi:MAG: fimbria/pilus periplasmic chaperone [Methylocella sp.]